MLYNENELAPGKHVLWVGEVYNGNVGEIRYADTEVEIVNWIEIHLDSLSLRELYEVYWNGFAYVDNRVIEVDDNGDMECDSVTDSGWHLDDYIRYREENPLIGDRR